MDDTNDNDIFAKIAQGGLRVEPEVRQRDPDIAEDDAGDDAPDAEEPREPVVPEVKLSEIAAHIAAQNTESDPASEDGPRLSVTSAALDAAFSNPLAAPPSEGAGEALMPDFSAGTDTREFEVADDDWSSETGCEPEDQTVEHAQPEDEAGAEVFAFGAARRVTREPEFEVIDVTQVSPEAEAPAEDPEPVRAGPGKPVLCLMGEFSAGKSTLSNLLIGTEALPVNVTATQLPPVWMSWGDEAPYRVGLDGEEYDVDLSRLGEVSVHDTAYIRIFHKADLLEMCDLIDMPGISDPNMDAAVWQRVIHHANAVIWCSHATQAWRQSEAAVWGTLPKDLYATSLLLLTRIDKILSDRDRMRVMRRVGKETNGLFREILPISLTQALAAGDDDEKLAASGAASFYDVLAELLAELEDTHAAEAEAQRARDIAAIPARTVMPSRVRPRQLTPRPGQSRPHSVAIDPLSQSGH